MAISSCSLHARADQRRLRRLVSSHLPQIENIVKKLSLAIFIFLLAAMTAASAQSQSSVPTNAAVATDAMTVARTTKAVHYRLQGGSTKVNFRGTDQLQRASGEARVEGKKTNFEIDAKFEGLEDAINVGLEFLTYVAWALSPQGRLVNLVEFSLDHNDTAHVKV